MNFCYGDDIINNYDVIIIGAGLSGLTAAHELVCNNKKILLIEKYSYIGGRTSSFDDNGMLVESGFHRHIGFYKELPKLLKRVGVNINDIVMWEEQIDIRLIDKKDTMVLGLAPFFAPFKFIKGFMGNTKFLSIKDKISMMGLFTAGIKDYLIKPDYLDTLSIEEYAKKHKVTSNTLNYIVTSLSTGIFFLPPNEYSAKVFFGLFVPGIPRIAKLRVGAYLGGMSDVLAKPISDAILKKGGTIKTSCEVINLIKSYNEIKGVELNNNEKIYADKVILAADLVNAKKLLKDIKGFDEWLNPILELPTMSSMTIQFDLNEPSLPYDRTTFAPQTIMTSFAEESRSTFKHTKGRLSVIIGNPDKYIDFDNNDIYNLIVDEALKLGIDIKDKILNYRVVREKDKFYHLGPNHDYLKPAQETPVKGLIIAGDYTRQPLYATMEGAVISGLKASKIALNK